MKYKTRQQRNLNFRKTVKRKIKKTNANITSYLNKRIMYKNRRHTIRFVKKYKKNTLKKQYGGLTGIEVLLLVGGIIVAVMVIAAILVCAMPKNNGCAGMLEGIDVIAAALSGGADNNTEPRSRQYSTPYSRSYSNSRPYYRRRNNILTKHLNSMTSWFKRRETVPMKRSIYNLLQTNKDKHNGIFDLTKTNLHTVFTRDQLDLLENILKSNTYEEFEAKISELAQQLDGNLTPKITSFLSTYIIFSTSIKHNNRVVARTLMKDIKGDGKKKSLSGRILKYINPLRLSYKPLLTMLTDLTRNPNAISNVVGDEDGDGEVVGDGKVAGDEDGKVAGDEDGDGEVSGDGEVTGDGDTATIYELAKVINSNLQAETINVASSSLDNTTNPNDAMIIKAALDEANKTMLDTALSAVTNY